MKMRRADREITEIPEILDIVRQCDVCRLGINDPDSGVPYLLPLNFAHEVEDDGAIVLYFHGATEGTKYRLLGSDPCVAFEMDCRHTLYSDASRGYCTMAYASVVGRGTVAEITDRDQKVRALQLIVDHYHSDDHFAYSQAAVDRTKVLALRVERMTAKARPLPNK